MTTTPTVAAAAPVQDWTRKYAFAGGLFYVLTFLSSIPALLLIASPRQRRLHRERRI